jgi:hypothetical protein
MKKKEKERKKQRSMSLFLSSYLVVLAEVGGLGELDVGHGEASVGGGKGLHVQDHELGQVALGQQGLFIQMYGGTEGYILFQNAAMLRWESRGCVRKREEKRKL